MRCGGSAYRALRAPPFATRRHVFRDGVFVSAGFAQILYCSGSGRTGHFSRFIRLLQVFSPVPMSSTSLRVFLLFSAGYFVSYVFRGVNLGFAPLITHEIGLTATDLGLLTSLYFLGFAGAQIPVGVLLGYYGFRSPRAGGSLCAGAGG